MGARNRSGIVAGLTAGLVLASGASPQDVPEGGKRLTLSFDTSARIDDNFNLSTPSQGTSAFVSHRLGLNYVSKTRVQRLAFGVSGLLRYGDIKGGSSVNGFDEPRITLDYDREAANAKFGLDAEYQESRVSFLRLAEDIGDELDPTDLISDRGTRALSRTSTTLELGTNGPLSVVFSLTHAQRDYTNVTNPELFDTRDTRGTVTARLKFSPVLTGRVEASLYDYSADDGVTTRRDTRRISVGLEGDLSEVLRFDVSVGHDHIETRQTIGTTVNDGFSGRLEITRDLPDGSFTALLENQFSTNGNRTTLRFGRVFETPRGALSVNVGGTRQEGVSQTYLVGRLGYTRRIAEDTFQLSLSRDIVVSSVENVLEVTQGSASYRRQVTEVSGLGLNMSYVDTRRIAGTAASTDRTRATLQLTYDHELSRDWVLTGGIEHRYLDTQGTGKAHSNAVFLMLGKSFDILQ